MDTARGVCGPSMRLSSGTHEPQFVPALHAAPISPGVEAASPLADVPYLLLHLAGSAGRVGAQEEALLARWLRGRGHEPAGGMLAASYRHDTNRELEPQLHEHVVIANMATSADGRTQALDARGIYAHATTAGHLAEAEMQHRTNRHGLAWTPTHRGIANVVGVGPLF